MKKMSFFMLLITIFFIGKNICLAECSYENQSKLYSDAISTRIGYRDNGSGLSIDMINLSESLYVNVTSPEGYNQTFNLTWNDIISFDWTDLNHIQTLTFKFYGNLCPDTLIYQTTLNTPMLNPRLETYDCLYDTKSLYVCEKYIDHEISDKEFYDAFEESTKISNKEKNNNTRVVDGEKENESFFTKHKVLIISLVLVIVIAIAIVIINKKGNKNRF